MTDKEILNNAVKEIKDRRSDAMKGYVEADKKSFFRNMYMERFNCYSQCLSLLQPKPK